MNLEADRDRDVRIDEARWPVVRATWPEVTTDANLDHYIDFVLGKVAKGERFAMVIDGRGTLGMTRAQHARAAQEINRNAPAVARHLIVALVVTNALARASLRAINALAPPPFPQRVFATIDEAVRWAEIELQRERVA